MNNIVDIAICGAGPVGQTLALLLLNQGVKKSAILLLDAKSEQETTADKRTIALSQGSGQILHSAGAWPIKATAIRQIHVSRKGQFGRTLIDSSEHQVPALGYVARYTDILAPLNDAIKNQGPELTFLRPAKVSTITETETHATLLLEDQRCFDAKIVVQAEGGVFSDQPAGNRHVDYQQSAIIATVTASSPVAGRAFERFTDFGPLALLPQEDGYALVWCVPPERAARLLALDDHSFLQELQREFGDRLGRFTHSTPRAAFALGLNAQTDAPVGRTVRIGNAAQTLHPVAGQGMNLGLRDALQLAKCLSKEVSPAALQDFYHLRSADRNMTIRLTDRMAQIFTTAGTVLPQPLLGAGLGLIDLALPAKKWLAGQMMFGLR
jgi:2-octaprenyl-6-methoxyphenol hydroxylase